MIYSRIQSGLGFVHSGFFITNLKDATVGTTHPTGSADKSDISATCAVLSSSSGSTTVALESFAASSSSFCTLAWRFLDKNMSLLYHEKK